jgi:release factor glutamine methyltransferase
MTAHDLLRDATMRLAACTETPRLDAEYLLAHVLGISRSGLLARLHSECPPEALAPFEHLLTRRTNFEPIPYILGRWEFFGLDLICRAPMLVPRPETEHLVEVALAHLATTPGPVLDLCTGTGCVALAIAMHAPGCPVTALDINPEAVGLAQENASLHAADLTVYTGDLFAALPAPARFEVITANPPYVEQGAWEGLSPSITRHEDPRALLAGEDGLDCVRRIMQEAPDWLLPGGLLALEIGETQSPAVMELLTAAGFQEVAATNDLTGIERIVHGRRA